MSSYNYNQTTQDFLQKHSNFNKSEQLAINNGFEVVPNERAYNGRYFVKDGKIWIHNISALKKQLSIFDNSKLEQMGYDVNAYFMYKC